MTSRLGRSHFIIRNAGVGAI